MTDRAAKIRALRQQIELVLEGAGESPARPRPTGRQPGANGKDGGAGNGAVYEAAARYAVRGPGTPPPLPLSSALADLTYCVVDVETTGGALYNHHRITEVCALRCTYDGRVLDEYHTLVNPLRPIPPYVTRLTNITADMVAGAPTFADIAEEVTDFLAGSVFVAHNAQFDRGFLDMELERALGREPEDGRVLCTVRLARKVVPEVRRRSLDALAYFFGVENEARHRAYGDARATVPILARMLARLEEREVVCWEGLERLLRKRKPRKKKSALPTSAEDMESC